MALRPTLETIDRRLAATVMAVCVTLLGAIVATISASVFSRFVVFNPLNFADPMSKYLMQWAAFLGVGLAIRAGEHVFVNMLYVSLGRRARRVMIVVINVLLTILFAAVLWYGMGNALSARTSSDPFVFNVPMVIPYLSVPVGALYALIQTNLSTWLALTGPDDADHAEVASV